MKLENHSCKWWYFIFAIGSLYEFWKGSMFHVLTFKSCKAWVKINAPSNQTYDPKRWFWHGILSVHMILNVRWGGNCEVLNRKSLRPEETDGTCLYYIDIFPEKMIATSAKVTPNDGWVREYSTKFLEFRFRLNLPPSNGGKWRFVRIPLRKI